MQREGDINMIDLPAHIDKQGWTIDDAKNKVICLFHWQGVQRTFEKSLEMAQEIIDTLNNRDAIASVVDAVAKAEGRKAGNPNFAKGKANPYK